MLALLLQPCITGMLEVHTELELSPANLGAVEQESSL